MARNGEFKQLRCPSIPIYIFGRNTENRKIMAQIMALHNGPLRNDRPAGQDDMEGFYRHKMRNRL